MAQLKVIEVVLTTVAVRCAKLFTYKPSLVRIDARNFELAW